jgi:hypothetical protein
MVNLDNFKKILEYENAHSVESYMADGVHVWPLLRNALCWDFYSKKNPRKIEFLQNIKYLLLKSIFFLKPIFSKCIINKSEALVVLPSQRRIKIDNNSYSIYSDPLADILKKINIQYAILEYGNSIVESPIRPTLNITNSLKWRLRFDRASKKTVAAEPDWFSNYAKLCHEVMGREIYWQEVSDFLLKLKTYTNFFEEIYIKSEAKYVFVICWFDLISMASILAAKKLGLVSIEIQHGYQGLNHSAYSMWFKAPEEGYELVPDIFWCWGIDSKNDLERLSPALLKASSAIPGGNLWLNKWKGDAQIIKTKGFEKRILVVLQRQPLDIVIETIKKMPPNIEWIFRFHPARSNSCRERDINYIRSGLSKNIKFEYPESSALYESFSNVSLIITEGSVVAIEALAFGLKSVIIGDTDLSRQALIDYKNFIEKGLMQSAVTSSELEKVILNMKFQELDQFNIKNIFSGQDESVKALTEILKK